MALRRWGWVVLAAAVACGKSPTGPTPPGPVGPATPPVIRSIGVPASRVEVEQDITLNAVVEDAETPLTQLTFLWTVNVGTIAGNGATATWRHAAGLLSGVDVVVTLTVVDKYQAIVNNQVVEREYRVVGQASPFRVHDSGAEMKELARKFLVDLFGNSSIPPGECLVDFSDTCASGKNDELNDITLHRQLVVVQQATIFSQTVSFPTSASAVVVSDSQFLDLWLDDGLIRPYRNDFVVTGVYEMGRWWICRSFVPDPATAFGSHSTKSDALYRNRRGGGTPFK